MEAKRRYTIDIPVPLQNKFRAIVAMKGIKMNHVIFELIEGYVEKNQKVLSKGVSK